MTIKFTALALAISLLVPFTARAADVPERGMSQQQVRERFGTPGRVQPAVGQPPITRWHYPGFTVYFENDRALHTVMEQADAGASAVDPRAGAVRVDPRLSQEAPKPGAGQEQRPPPVTEPRESAPLEPQEERPSPADSTADERARESMSSPAGRTPRAELDDPRQDQTGGARYDAASGRIITTEDSTPEESTPDTVRPDGDGTPPVATPNGGSLVPVTNPGDAP